MVLGLLHELPRLRRYARLRRQALSSEGCDEVGKKGKRVEIEMIVVMMMIVSIFAFAGVFDVDVEFVAGFEIER